MTAQGRCLELAKCLVQASGVLVLVSPGSGAALAARLNKYILYGDEVSSFTIDQFLHTLSIKGVPSCDYVLTQTSVTSVCRECQDGLLQFCSSSTDSCASVGLSSLRGTCWG